MDEEYYGECDHCEYEYELASATDHCAECGNCWTHCEDNLGHIHQYVNAIDLDDETRANIIEHLIAAAAA